MTEEKKPGKVAFDAMSEREREIRIDLQVQLNRVKGRSFTKDQIDQEVALLLAGKPGRLLASHGDLSAGQPRETIASVQAREEFSFRLQAIEENISALQKVLSTLPADFDRALAVLRAEVQIDLQQQADSILLQVKAICDRAVDRAVDQVATKIPTAPTAPTAKKEDKAAI